MSLNNIEIKLSDNVLWDFVCKTEDPTLDTLYHKEDVLGLLNDEKDIETEVVIVENKDPLNMMLDEVKSIAEYYNFGEVKFRVDFEDNYYPNVFVINTNEELTDVRIRQLSSLFRSRLNKFCDEYNILKSFESVKFEFQ